MNHNLWSVSFFIVFFRFESFLFCRHTKCKSHIRPLTKVYWEQNFCVRPKPLDKPESRLKYAFNLLSISLRAVSQKVKIDQKQAPSILLFGLILAKKEKFMQRISLGLKPKDRNSRKLQNLRHNSVRCLRLSSYQESKKKQQVVMRQSDIIENLSLQVYFKWSNVPWLPIIPFFHPVFGLTGTATIRPDSWLPIRPEKWRIRLFTPWFGVRE